MKHSKEQLYMVFDVESVGLHGEGFAVGLVVVNGFGAEIQSGLLACHPDEAFGESVDRHWVSQNVPKLESISVCEKPKDVRDKFWEAWMNWKSHGALLVADCCWPVEARFLAQCIDDLPATRNWDGPYPLLDLSGVLFAKGINPLQSFERTSNEIPAHNPLADARQSARILIENL